MSSIGLSVMATFLKSVGFIALGIVGLWLAAAVLHVGLGITADLFYWLTSRVLPGLVTTFLAGVVLWGLYQLFFGAERT